jgi:cobalt-precorrin 5A hydrolase
VSLQSPAILSLTPRGQELAGRIAPPLGAELLPVAESVRGPMENAFRAGRPLVCVMALGIVVRILGRLVTDKSVEAPVVVVDEAGRFAVSVMGGHAGANDLAERVAAIIGAMPVITTASDVVGLPAVDLIGHSRGWRIECRDQLTEVAAAVVRGEPIAIYQDAGSADWWQEFGEWPTTFQRVQTWPQGCWSALLAITDRHVPALIYPKVVYRPRTLVLGIGCRRGVSGAEIEALFQRVCAAHVFSPLSLGLVATVLLKAEEPGLLEFVQHHDVPLRVFSVEDLGAVPVPTPSAKVQEKIGIAGVAEPAALLAAGTDRLLMPKFKGERVTMAVARREEP